MTNNNLTLLKGRKWVGCKMIKKSRTNKEYERNPNVNSRTAMSNLNGENNTSPRKAETDQIGTSGNKFIAAKAPPYAANRSNILLYNQIDIIT